MKLCNIVYHKLFKRYIALHNKGMIKSFNNSKRQEVSYMKICPQCDTTCDDDSIFCKNCAGTLDQSPEQSQLIPDDDFTQDDDYTQNDFPQDDDYTQYQPPQQNMQQQYPPPGSQVYPPQYPQQQPLYPPYPPQYQQAPPPPVYFNQSISSPRETNGLGTAGFVLALIPFLFMFIIVIFWALAAGGLM